MATMTISYDGHSSVIKHLIDALLAAGAKIMQPTTDDEFYSDQRALRSFRKSVEQERQGLATEVSLEDVKQMLNL